MVNIEKIEYLEFAEIKNNPPEFKKNDIEEVIEPEEVIRNSEFLSWFESFINNK